MIDGHIRLHRVIQDHRFWTREPFTWAQAWIDLLMFARYKPGTIYIKGQPIELERGQLALSQLEMARRWKWSKGKVLRFLDALKTEHMAVQLTEHQAGHLTTILSICNYDKYQPFKLVDDTPNDTADDTPSGTPSSTPDGTRKNKDNKDKEYTCEKIAEKWNEIFSEYLSRVTKITATRRSRVKARARDHKLKSLEDWERLFLFIRDNCPYLIGTKTEWRMTFDWLMKSENFVKVVEGNYVEQQAS